MALQFELAPPEAVADIIHASCQQTPVYRGKTTRNSVYEGLAKFDTYAIKKDGNTVGSVIFRGNESHIAVLEQYRKKWCGVAFYRFLTEQVKKRGVLHVTCGNPDAIKFINRLEKRGFVCLVGKNY